MPAPFSRTCFACLVSLLLSLVAIRPLCAQEKSVHPGINKPYENPKAEEFVKQFESEAREVFAHRKEIVASCRIKPGMAVADIGAGTGLFTRLFAAEVGAAGQVYAVDIAPNFVEHIKKTCREAGLNNVKALVCKADSCELPPDSVDLGFLCDTYHHFEFPEKTLATIHRALRKGGRMVVVEYRRVEGKTPDWLMKHIRAGQEVFRQEIEAAGFILVEEDSSLKENYLLRFERVALPGTIRGIERLETKCWSINIDAVAAAWWLSDKRSGARWPTVGSAGLGLVRKSGDHGIRVERQGDTIRLERDGAAAVFQVNGDSLSIGYEGKEIGEIHVLGDLLTVTDKEHGAVIVPCREGLLIPADSGREFHQAFGSSDYEGCHMDMLGVLKSGSAMLVTWDDAYLTPEIRSAVSDDPAHEQKITTTLGLRRTARTFSLTPLGKGDWNLVASAYRQLAEKKSLVATLAQKIGRDPHAEQLVGAANVKLWTCLARRMNDDSTAEESVRIHWTFDEAAQVAEHLRNDIGISRCLFTIGGWTEGGYDCRHPDDLPANQECGGNQALAAAVARIQKLGYVACLHDNYQDMYRNAKSWEPACIEKRPDGSLVQGGRWLGGRAYIVCAQKQVELAMRPQNMPEIQKLFGPWCYFIDTTYAAGPQECADPKHPLDRNQDIAWKCRLSDSARSVFGLFGSECGREWAIPHSDFFEGLVAVGGNCYHSLKPESLGARVIPFWEMVYHDCQICYGKYGYAAEHAGPLVAHHVLCARPLYYHSIPDHLYWKQPRKAGKPADAAACFTRTDNGGTEGLHPTDAFLKNTHEVLGPLHAATAHDRLVRLEFRTPDGSLRRAVYGEGDKATTVTVNFGAKDAAVESRQGGSVVLPAYGFVVDGPKVVAFYAKRWNGREYPDGALYAIQPAGGGTFADTDRVRIFHGFGDGRIRWGDKEHAVGRERMLP